MALATLAQGHFQRTCFGKAARGLSARGANIAGNQNVVAALHSCSALLRLAGVGLAMSRLDERGLRKLSRVCH